MLLVATLYYASRPQRSSSRGKIYPCKTQTTDNQISPSGKLGKVCKQVANHTIYNLSTTFMVEVTGLEPAASASRTQRSTKLSHTSFFSLIGVLFSDCLAIIAQSHENVKRKNAKLQKLSENTISPLKFRDKCGIMLSD